MPLSPAAAPGHAEGALTPTAEGEFVARTLAGSTAAAGPGGPTARADNGLAARADATAQPVAQNWRRRWTRFLLVWVGMVASGMAVLAFAPVDLGVPFWPVAGVALVALWRGGPSYLTPVALGYAALALWWPAGGPAGGTAVGLAGVLAAAGGAWWLDRRGFDDVLASPRDAALWALACMLPVLLVAVTMSIVRLPGPVELPLRLADIGQRWIGLGLSTLITGMALLVSRPLAWRAALAPQRRTANLLLALAALASAWYAFLSQPATPRLLTPLAFLPPLWLGLLALRRGIPLAAWSLLVITAAGNWALGLGIGALSPVAPGNAFALLWGYAASLTAIVLGFGAIAGESLRMKERWQTALQGPNLGVADWHLHGGRGYTSPRWRHLLGDATGRRTATLHGWLAQVHTADRARLLDAIDALVAGPPEAALREQMRLRTPRDAGHAWFELHAVVAERDERGKPLRLVASLADIDERRAVEERQRLAAALFQHAHEGMMVTDAELRVLDANPSCSQILGLPRGELVGRVPPLLRPRADDVQAQARLGAMWASLRTAGSWRGEFHQWRSDGRACALQLTVSVVRGDDDQPQHHAIVVSDVTSQRDQRESLERQAHFDQLTRLPNRTRLAQTLGDAMAAADRDGHLLVVCYLDLDHFKPVNDAHGHAAGDRLLVDVAQRLRGALRGNAAWADTVARLGGDEFVLLIRAAGVEEARLAVERVLRVVAEPYPLANGAVVQVSASVGATVYPLDHSDADTLLRHADHAMYGAKQDGRNRYQFFDAEHSRQTEARVLAIGRVQQALDHHELELYYQPKVDMRRAVVLGAEALLRWNDPERGLVMPAQFLPLIEQTGLSARVGDWVLEQALDQLARWQHEGLDITVSVNVSGRHLQEPDFAQRLAELLARHERPLGPRLELEVLETAALADIDYTSTLLERCRRLGVRFALDDFGTGYSTLTYLKRLPVDTLKVDRSFVHAMLDDRQDLAIVQGVVSLARTFGCQVVAEGVESVAQARQLIEMGCDVGQGHGISRPMRAAELTEWARNYRGPFSIVPAPAPAARA